MSYPKKLKDRARQLAAEEDMSPEKIADLFSREADRREHDYRPQPRTIRNWLSEAKKEQTLISKQKLITKDMRLQEHFYELEKMAERLAENLEKLLKYKDKAGRIRYLFDFEGVSLFSKIIVKGNIIDGSQITEIGTDSSGKASHIIPELPEQLGELKPLDSFIASCLLEHINYRFPEVASYENWREINYENVSPAIIDKLRLLIYSKNFGFCPACPVCKNIQS